MRILVSFILTLFVAAVVWAGPDETGLDNNTAFYEGAKLSYIISPPGGFVMVTDPAVADNYSFAFIPEDVAYDSAEVRIGINIFTIKEEKKGKITIDDIITDDTTAIRGHFGPTLDIYEVDSMVTKSGYVIRNFFLNDSTTFIPNVMFSYLDGGNEVLIFDLSITLEYPRFMAEQVYMECLEKLKILVKGKLEAG